MLIWTIEDSAGEDRRFAGWADSLGYAAHLQSREAVLLAKFCKPRSRTDARKESADSRLLKIEL